MTHYTSVEQIEGQLNNLLDERCSTFLRRQCAESLAQRLVGPTSNEVTLMRVSSRSLIRTPFTTTFSPSWLNGLKTLTPNKGYRRLPNGLKSAASKATELVA